MHRLLPLFLAFLTACESRVEHPGAKAVTQGALPISQSVPSKRLYFERPGGFFVLEDESLRQLEDAPNERASFPLQSGDQLIVVPFPRADRVTVHRGQALLEEVRFPPFLARVAHFEGDRLFVGGYSEDGEQLTFLAVDGSNRIVAETSMPFADVTPWRHDAFRMQSLFDAKRQLWFVWVPERLEILAFNRDLKLENANTIPVPEELLDVADLLGVLADNDGSDQTVAACEAMVGKLVAALPRGFFLRGEDLAIGYQCAVLAACDNLDARFPGEPTSVHIRTELLLIDPDSLALKTRKAIEGRYAAGLFDDAWFCGRVQQGRDYAPALWRALL